MSSYFLHIYRGRRPRFHGTVPLMDVLSHSLTRMLGQDLSRAKVEFHILNVPAVPASLDVPILYNLEPEWGYCRIKVTQDGHLIYRHPHTIDQIISETLRVQLKKFAPEEEFWAFRVDIPGMPSPLPLPTVIDYRPAPLVKHSFWVDPSQGASRLGFSITRIEEEPLPLISLAKYGISPGAQAAAPIKVLLPRQLSRDLLHLLPMSAAMEEGGFLLGQVFREREAMDRHVVMVDQAVPAKHAGASLMHFTFTGDSFMAIKATLHRQFPALRIIGWYHTHLFPATPAMGLSSIDLDLHFSTFTMQWQLAALINQHENNRVLRFYRRDGATMSLCPHWATP